MGIKASKNRVIWKTRNKKVDKYLIILFKACKFYLECYMCNAKVVTGDAAYAKTTLPSFLINRAYDLRQGGKET